MRITLLQASRKRNSSFWLPSAITKPSGPDSGSDSKTKWIGACCGSLPIRNSIAQDLEVIGG